MEEYLSFVTIDVWTIIFTWGNLFILYLLMKKFLFKPVKEMIDKREQEVADIYEAANSEKEAAEKMRAEYEKKMNEAKEEAGEIVKNATRRAQLRSEEIIGEAQEKAVIIVRKADKQIEQEKKNAMNEIKNEISGMAVSLAEKVIEKDIDSEKHSALFDEFLKEIGDEP